MDLLSFFFLEQQLGTTDEEDRPTACVGICYYNKLMALEAKEDLANHNMVYKNQVSFVSLKYFLLIDC